MSQRRIGNYQITDYIGSGGFGSVFKADDVNTPGRVVAIKELHKKHTRNAVIKQRFFQEAVAMARLDHPNLPRLFTFGEDNGSYYLVMEFISGKLLTDEIQATGSLSPARAASIIEQVLDAVSYAHRNGIIHRDLKPDNIILVDEGGRLTTKVLDFGIARMVGGENLTLAGEGFGTPAYMSPERIAGVGGDDPRIDIYSLGIILFEMLSGKAPFESRASDPGMYWSEMRNLHSSEPLPALSSLGVPESLEKITRRATAKRLEDRYPTANEMLGEVRGSGLCAATSDDFTPTALVSNTRLALTTVPGDAEVFVDDVRRGTSDAVRGKIVIEGLTAGLHTVRVLKGGFNEYRINVSLEDDRQTDLQVALPARATVAMPRGEDTAAGGFDTLKLPGAEEKTALLVVESLPVGSTLFVGSDAVGQAGEDGRATIKLNPGAHEVRVTAPSGASAKSVVTVRPEDRGSFRTIALPIAGATTTRAPVVFWPEASGQGKRLAVAATIILLLALAAGAFYVIRGPGRPAEPVAADPTPQPTAPTDGGSDSTAAVAAPDNKRTDAQIAKAQSDSEKMALEKKLAEAEKKLAEERKAAEQSVPKPGTPATGAVVEPQPAAPEPPAPEPASVVGNDACVVVSVKGRDGQAAVGVRVGVMEQPNSGGAPVGGRTGPLGRWQSCGLTSGRSVSIGVFGPRGALLGGKQGIVLARGQNFVEIQVNRGGDTDEEPNPGPRKRRFPRQ
ncbi:MAG: serine/threonine-protein kinase [Acidobacteriota bacterium]